MARPRRDRPPGLLAPLRGQDFRRLWTGMAVSLLGDGITLIALAWQVYELSNAPSALAFVGVAMAAPQVALLLLGGAVSDRFQRRRVMLAADLVRGSALIGLGVLSASGGLQLWHVWAIAACYGAGTAFFGPAFEAIVPDLVPEALLPQANALDQLIRPAALRLAGPAVGGVLVGVLGPAPAFFVDAATFGVSVLCLLSIRTRLVPGVSAESMRAQIREGFAFVHGRVWLWGTLVAATLAYLVFLGPSEVLLPYVVKTELGGSATQLGLVLAMGGVGAMAASVTMGRRGVPRRTMTMIFTAWTVSTLMVAGYGLATHLWQLAAACFVFNALESAGLIAWVTTKQRLVPNRLLGRVSSLDWFISVGLLPLSYALVGPEVGVWGARTTLVVAGVVGAATTFAFLFLPGLRAVEGTVLPGHEAPSTSPPAGEPVPSLLGRSA